MDVMAETLRTWRAGPLRIERGRIDHRGITAWYVVIGSRRPWAHVYVTRER